jgi:hypothetical protein
VDASLAHASTGSPACAGTILLAADLEDFRVAVLDGRERLVPALDDDAVAKRLGADLQALECAVVGDDAHRANAALLRAETVFRPGTPLGDPVDVAAVALLLERGRDYYPRANSSSNLIDRSLP